MSETRDYPYGKLHLGDAHTIASGSNALLVALQEYTEHRIRTGETEGKLQKKGVAIGDALLDMARILVSRGVFSPERYLSEILIYSAAIVDGCEVCALTHIDGAIRAKVPEPIIDTVQAIALYIRAQADDDTHLLFESYRKLWERFEEWPHLANDRETNLKFYNLIALLMGMVVRKRRLVRHHAYELLTKSGVTPEELLEIIGIAQVMGGFPARWEAVHVYDIACELRERGALPGRFVSVLDSIPDKIRR